MVKVLFVCMGNICRSPMAEGVFRRMLEEMGMAEQVYVDSAGTHAFHTGSAPDMRGLHVAARRGVDLRAIRARRVEPLDLTEFDYVLAMDRENYQDLLALCPQPELHERIRLFMEYATDLPEQEVPDPYYGALGGFERVMDMMEEAAQGLLLDLRERYRL